MRLDYGDLRRVRQMSKIKPFEHKNNLAVINLSLSCNGPVTEHLYGGDRSRESGDNGVSIPCWILSVPALLRG